MFNFKTKIILQLANGHLTNPQQGVPISECLAVGHLVTVPMPSQMERDVTLSFAVLEAIFSLQVTYFLTHLSGKNFKVKSNYLMPNLHPQQQGHQAIFTIALLFA